MRIICVAGARPNFMKIAPLMEAFRQAPAFTPILVHTGQHYDPRMSDLFFQQLEIPQPDINLGVGSSSNAVQTADIMKSFEPVLLEHKPSAVLVVGDVNSTVACALVATKLGVRVIHVEAGLRSFDRTMPEEINRVLTDAISDLLFCTEQSGMVNLHREGVSDQRVFLVGNVMIDTLLKNRKKSQSCSILEDLHIKAGGYAVLTLHRPGNVDDPVVLDRLLQAIGTIQRDLPVIFPAHPRTRKCLESPGLAQRIGQMANLRLIEPAGYLEFLKLTSSAAFVLTDSGGIQEETTILDVPCLTLRDNTERPVTVEMGSNELVGTDPARILQAYQKIRSGQRKSSRVPPLWDGQAARRIVRIIAEELKAS